MTDDELRQEFAKTREAIADAEAGLKTDIGKAEAGLKADIAVVDAKVAVISAHLGIREEMENLRTVERASGSSSGLPRAAKGQS